MGLISSLLGYVPPEKAPDLVSIFPDAAVKKINNHQLPTILADKIILAPGEICHFVDVAAYVGEKNRRMTTHNGGSVHVFKGYTAHLGQSQSVLVPEAHYTKGILYITNKRVIFVASKQGFDKKIISLTAVTPYTNGIAFQFGSKTHTLLLPEGTVAGNVINMLI